LPLEDAVTVAEKVTCWLTVEPVGADELRLTEVPEAPTVCAYAEEVLVEKFPLLLLKVAVTLFEAADVYV
jgi:hypothetical protein